MIRGDTGFHSIKAFAAGLLNINAYLLTRNEENSFSSLLKLLLATRTIKQSCNQAATEGRRFKTTLL